jgi:hypothetical protein
LGESFVEFGDGLTLHGTGGVQQQEQGQRFSGLSMKVLAAANGTWSRSVMASFFDAPC